MVKADDPKLEIFIGCGHSALTDALPEDTALRLSLVSEPPAALGDMAWVYRVTDGTLKVRWLQEEAWADAAAGIYVMDGNPRGYAALRVICTVALGAAPVRLFSRVEGSQPPPPEVKPLTVDQIVPGALLFSGLWGEVPACLYALEATDDGFPARR